MLKPLSMLAIPAIVDVLFGIVVGYASRKEQRAPAERHGVRSVHLCRERERCAEVSALYSSRRSIQILMDRRTVEQTL